MVRRLLVPAVFLLLIAACSPEGSPDGGGGGGASPGSEPSSATSTDSGSGGDGSSGGGAATACDLITADEVATVMSVDSVEVESVEGIVSYCSYTSGGASVVATSYSAQDAEMVWASYQNDGPSVSGLGDKAVFSESSGTLFIVKGDSYVGITAGTGDMDPADRQALEEQLGAIAVGRL